MNTVEAARALCAREDDSWYAQPAWEAEARTVLSALADRADALADVARFAWLTVSAFERYCHSGSKDARRHYENMQRRLADELDRAGITFSYLEHRDWPERDLRRAGAAQAPVKLLYVRADTLIDASSDYRAILALPASDWMLETRLALHLTCERVELLEQIAHQAWHCHNAWQLFYGVGGSTPLGSAHNRVSELLGEAGIDLRSLAARTPVAA